MTQEREGLGLRMAALEPQRGTEEGLAAFLIAHEEMTWAELEREFERV